MEESQSLIDLDLLIRKQEPLLEYRGMADQPETDGVKSPLV